MKKIFIGLLLLSFNSLLFAQKTHQIEEVLKDDVGETLFVKFKNVSIVSNFDGDVEMLETAYGKISNTTFKFIRQFNTQLGNVNKIYQQYSRNLKVEGAYFSIHTIKGKVESVSGNYAKRLPSSTIKTLSFKAAEAKIKEIEMGKSQNEYLKSEGYEIVFSKNEIKNLKDYRLAYRIKLFCGNINNYKYYVIDANTGEILNIEYTICSANAAGTGNTLYSGVRNITTDDFNTGAQFRLREIRGNGVNIITLNNNNSNNETGALATDFTDNDNNWTVPEHPNDRAALDAHWGAERVFDYWLNVHGRNSLNNNGMAIRSFVHVGVQFDNGYWSPNNQAIFYGDGNTLERPTTSLDWCGHELGHGVCQFTSNLSK